MKTHLLLRRIVLAAAAPAAVLACGDTSTLSVPAARPAVAAATADTAAILMTNNRAIINPAALGGLDLTQTVWLAWDGNEYLSLFDDEASYAGLRPAAHNKLIRRADGWFETQAPVAGARFTAVQLDAAGNRTWAQLPIGWAGVSQTPARYECGTLINGGYSVSLHLPRNGYPAATYNSWIRKRRLGGDTTQLVISRFLLPVNASQLSSGWRLVGDSIGWTYAEGLSPYTSSADALTFRISGPGNGGLVNVRAPAVARPAWPSGTDAWGRFGHLATGELDGYKHPYIHLDCSVPGYGTIGVVLP